MQVVSIQMSSNEGETREQRIARAQQKLGELYASGERPTQILFPEMWATGFFSFDDYHRQSEPEQGEIYETMAAWARKFNCYLHSGSFSEREDGRFYNTSLLLDPNGRIVGKYRKIHLFGYQSKEPEVLTPGSQVGVFDTEYGRVGMSTCYDLRFPELFRAMVNLGAEFFLVTSAWPIARLAHWKLFNQVRAIEEQCFLISCNGTGAIAGSQLAGNSMVVDPAGVILAQGDEQETVVCCDIDPACVKQSRTTFPALKDKILI